VGGLFYFNLGQDRMKPQISEQLDRIETMLHKQAVSPFTLEAAAEYLHISKSYLYKLTSRAAIAHYKPGGKKIIFDKQDLDRYLFRNRVRSLDEIRDTVNKRPIQSLKQRNHNPITQ
jgi:excisionase family DNA binding protein